jgi:RNA polymerase sigma-70 factor, ECF subfamily
MGDRRKDGVNAVARKMSSLGVHEDRLEARCRAGDLEAFEEVYTRWERPILRYAYGMLNCADDADDVKQETFLKAFRCIHSFDSRCAIHTWLFRICANLCKDRLKQRGRRPQVSLEQVSSAAIPPGPDTDPLRRILADAEHDLVLRALQDLPTGHRELLLLREVQGMSYDEIKDVFGCSLASVKLRLFRARQQWRRRYHQLNGEGEA